jgi:DNA helicase II / ATP-dependent DNA helicase PcrA
MDYLSHLNFSQRKAVTTIDGAVCVIAGAGSGKTRVIEYRVLHLIRKGIDPRSILLLSFTRKAAQEMLLRASGHDGRCAFVRGGTFHSFAYGLLREHGGIIGLPSTLSILDGSDSEDALHRCGIRLGYIVSRRKGERAVFPKKRVLNKILSMSRNKNISVKEILDADYPQFSDLFSQIESVGSAYSSYKFEKGYLDYDDLLFCLVKLLRVSNMRDYFSSLFSYLMIDEYQDTNSVQGEIVRLLGRGHGNVMIVGDDAQSIYGFRGADHKNIMEFPSDFVGAKIISLEENYRSTQEILNVANAVLDSMSCRYEKRLSSVGGKDDGDMPSLLVHSTPYEEARWICSRIEEFVKSGISISCQAVLFRSSFISIPLQTELTRRGINFRVFGGQKFYESAHIKDVIAHLRLVFNIRDELAWQRVLLLIDGIGLKTADAFFEKISNSSSLIEVADILEASVSGRGYSDEVGRFCSLVRNLEISDMSVRDQFLQVVEYYTPIVKTVFDNWRHRINDLEIVSEMAGQYESLQKFLADFIIESPQNIKDVRRSYVEGGLGAKKKIINELDDEALTLSTIHSAKGLEWDIVFFVGLAEGVLPSKLSIGDDEKVSEEHRLLYVGITRAKRYLFLSISGSSSRFGGEFPEMSRFLTLPGVLDTIDHNVDRLGVDDDDDDLDIDLEVW